MLVLIAAVHRSSAIGKHRAGVEATALVLRNCRSVHGQHAAGIKDYKLRSIRADVGISVLFFQLPDVLADFRYPPPHQHARNDHFTDFGLVESLEPAGVEVMATAVET